MLLRCRQQQSCDNLAFTDEFYLTDRWRCRTEGEQTLWERFRIIAPKSGSYSGQEISGGTDGSNPLLSGERATANPILRGNDRCSREPESWHEGGVGELVPVQKDSPNRRSPGVAQ